MARTPQRIQGSIWPDVQMQSQAELLSALSTTPDKQSESVETRTAQEYRAEINRLKTEVQRLNALVVQKDDLLLSADLRIRKLQEFAPKLRGGRQPARPSRQELVDTRAEGSQPPQQAKEATGMLVQPAAEAGGQAGGFAGAAAKPASAGAKRKQPEGATRPGWCHHNRQRYL